MSKIIWSSDTEQGVICERHINSIRALSETEKEVSEHTYEMYDEDCETYQLTDAEFLQIADQINSKNFIYLEAGTSKLWLNKRNFTDAVYNSEICEINGWEVEPLIFVALMNYVEAKNQREMAKKIAHEGKKNKMKTPEGIDKLIHQETKEYNERIANLEAKKKAMFPNPNPPTSAA